MVTFHALTDLTNAKLWVFRDRTDKAAAALQYDAVDAGTDARGWRRFDAALDHQVHERVHALLHDDDWQHKEGDAQTRTLPRTDDFEFVSELWIVQGANRVLTADPLLSARTAVRIHLVSKTRYRDGSLYLWAPGLAGRSVKAGGMTAEGPYFDVDLAGVEQSVFCFKFEAPDGKDEPDIANRLWVAADGAEVWAISGANSITTALPTFQDLAIRVFDFGAPGATTLHLWQADSDFQTDLPGVREASGWLLFDARVYSGPTYNFKLQNSELQPAWEHDEAIRNVWVDSGASAWTMDGDGSQRQLGSGVWTLEGDHELFAAEPARTHRVQLEVSSGGSAPRFDLASATQLHAWVNRARLPLCPNIERNAQGGFAFDTFPNVVTSCKLCSADGSYEPVDRHTIKVDAADADPTIAYLVIGRPDLLSRKPAADQFLDPPFVIERPGMWVEGDALRFAIHCPTAAFVELMGEWTGWQAAAIPLHSTLDGTYFWAEMSVASVTAALARNTIHGALYKLILNQVLVVQDPAADWVESSEPDKASKLVDHALYSWRSSAWQRPGWDYLIVYQLHPSRFSQRTGTTGLDGITREIQDTVGYLRSVGATALLLMPTSEFQGDVGWGYNPSFFYAVESAYGGPDALKRLVDACHEQGIAVMLDVVFNHAGTADNVLWTVARESFFDGDTAWGAMLNFDESQVRHFFEQNLTHFMRNYRVDGFRFDFTRVIRYGGTWSDFVRMPGSGGGWEFMHGLRRAVHAVDDRCLFMAENLPNEWDLTNYGGPMDTQWCDDFHDRMVDAVRGWSVLGSLGDAMRYSSQFCNQWYETTNYPESHDEVGNLPNRISSVAGIGQGYRRNKVAAGATLLCRGIPMWFMGAEAGEWRQFSQDGSTPLDLNFYEQDPSSQQLRHWWADLCALRVGNTLVQGPSPIDIRFVDQNLLAFSRGEGSDLFVVLNFGNWSGWRSLAELNLPDGEYKERLNSTWGNYRISTEAEDEHGNGGWDAHISRGSWLNVPDYGVLVLQRR